MKLNLSIPVNKTTATREAKRVQKMGINVYVMDTQRDDDSGEKGSIYEPGVTSEEEAEEEQNVGVGEEEGEELQEEGGEGESKEYSAGEGGTEGLDENSQGAEGGDDKVVLFEMEEEDPNFLESSQYAQRDPSPVPLKKPCKTYVSILSPVMVLVGIIEILAFRVQCLKLSGFLLSGNSSYPDSVCVPQIVFSVLILSLVSGIHFIRTTFMSPIKSG